VSTSSGTSSRGSGASHHYDDEEDPDLEANENSRLMQVQTPVRVFVPGTQPLFGPMPASFLAPASLTPKDFCSIQVCNEFVNEDKNTLIGDDKKAIDSRWFH
jgi:hypothetical protein